MHVRGRVPRRTSAFGEVPADDDPPQLIQGSENQIVHWPACRCRGPVRGEPRQGSESRTGDLGCLASGMNFDRITGHTEVGLSLL
ncbi:MAG: hypothetical protein DMG57_44660 [Acidobacteria bacterium]|nr:MAG: hypothetical protein DMG57_44660 [Acidobacteriota bacterium]